ncbi:hypothetical protein CFC21_054620 [Triticum aestivum]|uniref:non-specific serine/threonine protein kinase n=2 Tax=Triticum aestivum TaxID=4565 RepID=A0A9R1K990_WHEAT|nr:hypothetical protein CFC21_054616 [Triticum aestivum]KAF7045522.1 hypothetical protein CFC21_054620 [Triticum aestivum]
MIILLLLILGFKPLVTAADPLAWRCDSHFGNEASTYKANIKLLSAALSMSVSSTQTIFGKGFTGTEHDRIYGTAQCRGDANASACPSCITTAFQDIRWLCVLQTVSAVLYEDCIVLLQETAKQAAYNSTMMYATGRLDIFHALPLLYSLAQCNLDLPPNDCWNCLKNISSAAKSFFKEQHGEWISGTWCNFRYSTNQFYEGQPMQQIDCTSVCVKSSILGHIIKVLIITTVVLLLASFFCFITWFGLAVDLKNLLGCLDLYTACPEREGEELVWGIGRSSEFKLFDFSQVSDATSNFSDENKLGQGGFGPVYKGQLPKGMEIAIKRLASNSCQGFTEFKNEVQLIAKLQHTNLVRLLGCCSQGEEKILIYEYLPNKSLDSFIFDETKKALLKWNKRKVIIEGIAQGLLYLHKHSRLRVIHRDLKASNILLDSEMNPKISDFGLAKIFSSNDTEGNTKRIAGTYGYMAPEYASEGLFSIKSDVFSFGVLILEIIHGKRNSCFHQFGDFFNLLGYAWKLWKEERWLEFVDESIVSESHASETMRCINIALLCVQENAADRPTTISVVTMLSSESMTLPEPKHPAYFHIRVTEEEPLSANDVTMSALQGR